MVMTEDETPRSSASSEDPISEPQTEEAEVATKVGYLLKVEQILISRERFFAVASTVVTALFTVVLALSTVFLWKETKDLRNLPSSRARI